MKTIITLLLLTTISFAQVRFNKTEYFTLSTSVDISASIKENGLDVVTELEYVGIFYAKMGIESFSVLQGRYRDYHGALGVNLTSGYFEKFRYYAGIRVARVFRGEEGAYRFNTGLEAGIDVDIAKHWFVGVRGTLDKRNDQEIYNWTPETKLSSFIRIGYKWYYK